jgi:23S rRNA pseudouridine955/2504/2580 synthase
MQISINKNYHSSRVDRFLREHFDIPQSLVAKLVREKKIKVNKKRVDISTHLQEGDTVFVYYVLEQTATFHGTIDAKKVEEFKIWIIHEDDDVLVINKPEGVSSQSGTKAGLAVDVFAKAYFPEARITHRLDRETSGVMVIAKNKFTAREITGLFAKGEVVKKYYAVVNTGDVKMTEGVIETDLQKSVDAQKMFTTQGSSCVTHYRVVQKSGEFALVEVTPKTGKMHQIRVHLSSIGMPIIGDEKYGGTPHQRMFLHAFSITFDGKTFSAPLPVLFQQLGFTAK